MHSHKWEYVQGGASRNLVQYVTYSISYQQMFSSQQFLEFCLPVINLANMFINYKSCFFFFRLTTMYNKNPGTDVTQWAPQWGRHFPLVDQHQRSG